MALLQRVLQKSPKKVPSHARKLLIDRETQSFLLFLLGAPIALLTLLRTADNPPLTYNLNRLQISTPMNFFDPERCSEPSKVRDYRNVFITQSALIFVALFLAEILRLLRAPMPVVIHDCIYTVLGAAYFYLLWDLIKNFIQHRVIIMALFCYLAILFGMMLLLQNPFFEIIQNTSHGFAVLHIGLLTVEVLTISLAFRDVFGSRTVTNNNLWGAVSLFLMIAISFASVYELLNLLEPSSFGIPLAPGFSTFSEMLHCSLLAISGSSPSLQPQTVLVRNVIAIESLGGNLYLVILIGRMLGFVSSGKS